VTGNDQPTDPPDPRGGDAGDSEALVGASGAGADAPRADVATRPGVVHASQRSVPDRALPFTDVTREFRVHPAVPRLWFWQAVAWPMLLGALSCGGLLAAGWERLGQLAAAATLLAAWALTAHAQAYAERLRLLLLGDGLVVRRGVLWRTETFVPRARVQHTDVSQGPIGRHYGVATLRLYTAASHAGVIEVEGLGRGDAVTIRDALLGRGDPDAL